VTAEPPRGGAHQNPTWRQYRDTGPEGRAPRSRPHGLLLRGRWESVGGDNASHGTAGARWQRSQSLAGRERRPRPPASCRVGCDCPTPTTLLQCSRANKPPRGQRAELLTHLKERDHPPRRSWQTGNARGAKFSVSMLHAQHRDSGCGSAQRASLRGKGGVDRRVVTARSDAQSSTAACGLGWRVMLRFLHGSSVGMFRRSGCAITPWPC